MLLTRPGREKKNTALQILFIALDMTLAAGHWDPIQAQEPAEEDDILTLLPSIIAGSPACCPISYRDSDPKYGLQYLGLYYFSPDMSHRKYGLAQLSDLDFNRLSLSDRRKVADKLLSTLFFGYPEDVLLEKINARRFLCNVRKGLMEETNDMVAVEVEIRDEARYYHSDYAVNEVYDILARFYAMEHLDRHYLHNWMAYILTQTILFSPAYELDSTHYPNVASVYNWLVIDMNDDIGMRYSTYLHMTDSNNWRRFRSPEDNGREMLEIYAFDFADAHVPRAARTLQNWYLDEDGDTLVIGLNENTVPQYLFDTWVTTGFDFYRELVKSDGFHEGVTRRLVDFFFLEHGEAQKAQITAAIVQSQPETWQDILVQIVFSEEYLLHTSRVKSAEEMFYSLVKKLNYKHHQYSFSTLTEELSDMNQATMKYKLGKLDRVPLDTISFAEYHKFIRERVLIRNVCGTEEENDYLGYSNYGWRSAQVLSEDYFTYIELNPIETLTSFINYLFNFMIHRNPTAAERDMFIRNMLDSEHGGYLWGYNFNRMDEDKPGCYYTRENAAEDVFDYMSRLTEFYRFQEVQ